MADTKLKKFLETKRADFIAMSDEIWGYAELCFKEVRSCRLQKEYLIKEGFEVQEKAGGLDTAFVGSFSLGSGKPVIGILGEYDALEGLSQKAGINYKEPLKEGEAGHGCGHQALGGGALEACVAVKDYMEENHLEGTIRYYGCPAEEGGSGKAFLVKAGVFDDADICLTWHPGLNNSLFNQALANIQVDFQFHGVSAHAAGQPHIGRSALDAVELMNVGANYLREHMVSDAKVHYAITDSGGTAPNIIPAYASVRYGIRALKMSTVKELYDRVVDIARGAALMTQTSVEYQVGQVYQDFLPNETLDSLAVRHMRQVIPARYTNEEMEEAKYYQQMIAPETVEGMKAKMLGAMTCEKPSQDLYTPVVNFVYEGEPPFGLASTDAGNVSWVVPMTAVYTSCYVLGSFGHSWQMVAQGKSKILHKGMYLAAEILASMAVNLMEEPKLVEMAKEDFKKATEGKEGRYFCGDTPGND